MIFASLKPISRIICNESAVRYAYYFAMAFVGQPQVKSLETSALIENEAHNKFLSIVSLWEIELKRNIGKLSLTQPIETLLPQEIVILPLQIEHIGHLKNLPFHHRDRFDRIIISQAIVGLH